MECRTFGMVKPSQADRDSLVRSVLSERGDSGETPRHTLFFFYGGDLEGLRSAALADSYQVSPTVGREGLVLETVIAVDEQAFARHAQRMDEWAEAYGCDYDGWECQLLIQ
jgi:Regulator of ribonuclease activity B